MKFLKKNIVLRFVVTLFIVGFLTGAIAFLTVKPDLSTYIEEFKDLLATNNNTFLLYIGLTTLVFILSASLIGLPVLVFYLFYEGFATGYTLLTFFSLYQMKGMLFYLIFFILTKLLYLIIIFYFSITAIRFIGRMINLFIHKDYHGISKPLVSHFLRYILILVIMVINSTLIYFFSNRIISLFVNLIS